MKYFWNQLKQQHPTSNVWLLTGLESLLIEENKQWIRRQYIHFEWKSVSIDHQFNWKQFELELQNQGLFAAQEVFELVIPEGKAGRQGSTWLKALMDLASSDRHWVIVAPNTKGNWVQQTAWAKTLANKGVHVHHPLIGTLDRQQWAQSRLDEHQLNIAPQALKYLDFMCEGNLLALKQELDHLIMLGEQPIDEARVRAQSQDQARFSPFDLIECWLNRNGRKALRVLRLLRGEGTDPNLINALLIREITILVTLSELQTHRQPLDAYFKSIGAWSARQRQLLDWVAQYPMPHLLETQRALGVIDRQCKGLDARDPWLSLERLLIMI